MKREELKTRFNELLMRDGNWNIDEDIAKDIASDLADEVTIIQDADSYLLKAARAVVDSWDGGDLAGAVNLLREGLECMEIDGKPETCTVTPIEGYISLDGVAHKLVNVRIGTEGHIETRCRKFRPVDAIDGSYNLGDQNCSGCFADLVEPSRIMVTVEGGVIQSIDGVPDGVVVEVHDYDTDGADEGLLDTDEQGRTYICLTANAENKPVAPLHVRVHVRGGIAELGDCSPGIEVEIIDHDDLEEEGKS